MTKGALSANGRAWCTTLVRTGRLADRYLDRLAASGLLVPRGLAEVGALFEAAGLGHEEILDGSLAVIRAGFAG